MVEPNKKWVSKGSSEGPYNSEMHSSGHGTPRFERKGHILLVSAALVVGGILGLIQVIFLISEAKSILNLMGVHSDSHMLIPAQEYSTQRSLGVPLVLPSLAMQGVLCGLKDVKTLPCLYF